MTNIHWPAIIQYDSDPELEYLENDAALIRAIAASDNTFEQSDRLIDSKGQVFPCWQLADTDLDNIKPAGKTDLETVLGLIKAHLADAGSCCVAKAYAPTISDAILMVKNNQCDID